MEGERVGHTAGSRGVGLEGLYIQVQEGLFQHNDQKLVNRKPTLKNFASFTYDDIPLSGKSRLAYIRRYVEISSYKYISFFRTDMFQ